MKSEVNSDPPLWAADHAKPRGKSLRTGFSTGSAAAAAAKSALLTLLARPCPPQVEIALPLGGELAIPIRRHRRNGAWSETVVIKDAGDDPDVTHGAEIGARVRWLADLREEEEILLTAGEGVGKVTKPGLPVAVGEPAINPVPRTMIRRELRRVWQEFSPGQPLRLAVEIFVPAGEELARHTLNSRLGIVGGISILGTTGLVKPFSHQAYRATIVAALKVARALGIDTIVLTTGGKSESHLRTLLPEVPEEALVQMGDYVAFALKAAARLGFADIVVGAFFGKAVKIAQGWKQTHASRGLVNLPALGHLTRDLTGDHFLSEAVAGANTARQALELLAAAGDDGVIAAVGADMLAALTEYADFRARVRAVILDFNGSPLWRGQLGGA